MNPPQKQKKKRSFVQVDGSGRTLGPVYHNASAHGAATKAASRGYKDIYLYDRGQKRVYAYTGSMEHARPNAFTKKNGITGQGKAISKGYYNVA